MSLDGQDKMKVSGRPQSSSPREPAPKGRWHGRKEGDYGEGEEGFI